MCCRAQDFGDRSSTDVACCTKVLVTSDHVATGEKIIIRIFDSDRFSSDDALGMVQVDLVKMMEFVGNNRLRRQHSRLKPAQSGMKCSGTLEWSWGFFPIWKMSSESEEKKQAEEEELRGEGLGGADPGTGREGNAAQPGLLYKLMKGLAPEPFAWEQERKKRRLDSLAWLTGQRARETLEASQPPSLERRCGVLKFHIHQAHNLQMQDNSGTWVKGTSRKTGHGAIGGRPGESWFCL
jgi:Ca2+-dependent lipid-binding protein